MTRRQSKADKALDKQIEAIFYKHCHGVQVPVLDIGKIFEAGRVAARNGLDIEAAVLFTVASVRLN